MSKIMMVLAEEWILGVSICIFLCILVYLIFSIRLVISCRRNKYDIGVLGMLPVVNIIIFIKNNIRKKGLIETVDDSEEFELY